MIKIYRIIIINLLLLLFSNFAYTEITYVEINAKGKAESYEIALKKALKEAISKVNGVT